MHTDWLVIAIIVIIACILSEISSDKLEGIEGPTGPDKLTRLAELDELTRLNGLAELDLNQLNLAVINEMEQYATEIAQRTDLLNIYYDNAMEEIKDLPKKMESLRMSHINNQSVQRQEYIDMRQQIQARVKENNADKLKELRATLISAEDKIAADDKNIKNSFTTQLDETSKPIQEMFDPLIALHNDANNTYEQYIAICEKNNWEKYETITAIHSTLTGKINNINQQQTDIDKEYIETLNYLLDMNADVQITVKERIAAYNETLKVFETNTQPDTPRDNTSLIIGVASGVSGLILIGGVSGLYYWKTHKSNV